LPLQIGDMAPDFELSAVSGDKRHTVRLSDYRGRQRVVLTFHPVDWTPT
jgi:peroxiredoxin